MKSDAKTVTGPAVRQESRGELCDLLLSQCSLDAVVVGAARSEAHETGARLEVVLRRKGLVSDAQLARATAEYLGLPPIDLSHFVPDEELVRDMPARLLNDLHALPLERWGTRLAVVVPDPFDLATIDEIRYLTGFDVVCYVAPEGQVAELLREYGHEPQQTLEEVIRDVPDVSPEFESGSGDEEVSVADSGGSGAEDAVVRIVNSILLEALHRRASDVHIEPTSGPLRVRYRIDGVLYDQPSPPKFMQWPVLSRLKIIASLDIGERRMPQDGRFTIHALGRDADVRVSLIPTVYGQKAVLRILDKRNLSPDLASLGLEKEAYDRLAHAIHQPHGMILVTGPTGSGKTTTLYSALQELNQPGVNIITVEDPVEYRIQGINQIQVRPEIGLTFAAGLRSILRQDPNIVMVGEIRDPETATIAVQAAMTGHLVLSTLHTNDAAGAVTRLIHMGIEPFLIASSLVMTQAQRIFRRLCPACKRRRVTPAEVLRAHGIDQGALADAVVYGPRGCGQCASIGYLGRAAIMEILPIDDTVRELILQRAATGEVRRHAAANGMMSLRDVGLLRVRRGVTSIEEILRVTACG